MVDTMKKYKSLLHAAAFMLLATITGCGGGSTTVTHLVPTTATVKLSTAGTLTQNLSGISISVTLPDGVTPGLATDGTVASFVASASGVATPGTILSIVYTPATATTKGKLLIPMITNNTAGFGTGEFLTLTLDVAAGSSLTAANFALGDFDPVDVGGNHLAAGILTPSVSAFSIR